MLQENSRNWEKQLSNITRKFLHKVSTKFPWKTRLKIVQHCIKPMSRHFCHVKNSWSQFQISKNCTSMLLLTLMTHHKCSKTKYSLTSAFSSAAEGMKTCMIWPKIHSKWRLIRIQRYDTLSKCKTSWTKITQKPPLTSSQGTCLKSRDTFAVQLTASICTWTIWTPTVITCGKEQKGQKNASMPSSSITTSVYLNPPSLASWRGCQNRQNCRKSTPTTASESLEQRS